MFRQERYQRTGLRGKPSSRSTRVPLKNPPSPSVPVQWNVSDCYCAFGRGYDTEPSERGTITAAPCTHCLSGHPDRADIESAPTIIEITLLEIWQMERTERGEEGVTSTDQPGTNCQRRPAAPAGVNPRPTKTERTERVWAIANRSAPCTNCPRALARNCKIFLNI